MNNDRLAIFQSLKEVIIDNAYSNLSINKNIDRFNVYSGSYVRNNVKGVLRNLMLLDFYIDNLANNGIKSIKDNDLILLRMGIYEIMLIDSIPNYATVNEIVEIAKKKCKGRDKFINGILRNYIRRKGDIKLPSNPMDKVSVEQSFPKWLAEMIFEQFGSEEGLKIIEGLNSIPLLTLRVNRLKTNRDDVLKELRDTIPAESNNNVIIVNEGDVLNSDCYKNGKISVQGIASINAINCLNPVKGSRVLDMCAAPGGKTTYMAELMNNDGHILACDIYDHRLNLINKECKRLNIDIVETKAMDGTSFDKDMEKSFDYVLADVPCSGLGVINKKPEIRYNITKEKIEQLLDIQLGILKNAGEYVKIGGYILYSTCTINKDENEGIINKFLNNNDKFKLVEKYTALPYNGKVDGFFYCKLCRLN
jgi:16S rRNA (cytosine967-C5)-methyltransferase